jgi:hypothetical protein
MMALGGTITILAARQPPLQMGLPETREFRAGIVVRESVKISEISQKVVL